MAALSGRPVAMTFVTTSQSVKGFGFGNGTKGPLMIGDTQPKNTFVEKQCRRSLAKEDSVIFLRPFWERRRSPVITSGLCLRLCWLARHVPCYAGVFLFHYCQIKGEDMELIEYLLGHFLSKDQLLDQSRVSATRFHSFQEKGVMPQCSYRLGVDVSCDSFFGHHLETRQVEFYAKGSAAWLGMLQELTDPADAFAVFQKRYRAEIQRLNQAGFSVKDPKLNEGLESHLIEEWQHFINGTYGLCTTSGLPEDIAAKELAISIIKPWQDCDTLTKAQLRELASAIDLLDRASARFAPHERAKSSRHRLINEVRRKYRF